MDAWSWSFQPYGSSFLIGPKIGGQWDIDGSTMLVAETRQFLLLAYVDMFGLPHFKKGPVSHSTTEEGGIK